MEGYYLSLVDPKRKAGRYAGPSHHKWGFSEDCSNRRQDGLDSVAYGFRAELRRELITPTGGDDSGPGEGFDVVQQMMFDWLCGFPICEEVNFAK